MDREWGNRGDRMNGWNVACSSCLWYVQHNSIFLAGYTLFVYVCLTSIVIDIEI